ncbi:hypothetical protein PENTCL1PPCAC_23539 [Pristionchus entomophagus]|uniref:RNA-directed RNA polymerase n=1 Tax=Pristionchus entomophagus TaxID=358040 RepID=A0AAV5U514_9BILA|nr:hypothetical protein PENTCL1PPCAC_23539 [Pristionchus entomophagus]
MLLIFQAEAKRFEIEVSAQEDIQIIGEGRRYVLSFQAICADWQSTLIRFVYQFMLALMRNSIASHERPLICTHSLLLYPLRLENIQDNMPLSHLHFGSLSNNGRLNIHWSMAGGSLDCHDREFGHFFHKGIYASFEYDTRYISIGYCNKETDPQNRDLDYEVQGRISFEMSSIQRIILDQWNKDDEHLISLVLLLEFPPRLQVRRKFTTKASWEYRDEIQRGNHPGERSNKQALHDSKAVILQFDRSGIEKSLDWDTSIEVYVHDILSRLRHKTGKRIEYASMDKFVLLEGEVKHVWVDERGRERLNKRLSPVCPYFYNLKSYNGVRRDFDEEACRYIFDAAERLIQSKEGMDSGSRAYHVRWKAFRLHALLQGIVDRGMEHRIELLFDRAKWHSFIKDTADLYGKFEERTLFALERVMTTIAEGRPNCSIPVLFLREWADSSPYRRSALFSEQEKQDGYWRIMKLVVTPTRVIFVGYEYIMGNRVLNKYAKNENHIIRVSFRDDRGGPMKSSNYAPEVQARIKNILVNGVTYAGRTFAWLGNSNSQFKDQGCYMMHIDFSDWSNVMPHDIRTQMGEFHRLPNIPKMLARLGQVFTQCKPSEMALNPSEVGVTFDLVGGKNLAGKPYIFSDGVGCISLSHAEALSREHELDSVASAVQIRFRGEKGLLCMDPSIDERNSLLRMMGLNEEKKMLVRPSMIKFEVMDQRDAKLEIVKLSKSAVTYLNRPFINILCQASDIQSDECHMRIKGRIKELLHSQLRESIQALYVERKALEAIREMSFPLLMEVFTLTSDLLLTNEPFFASLLRVNIKYVIQKQLSRMKIRIPTSSGRSMFGVVDYSGLLQYGQIFCQYTGSVSKFGQRQAGNRRGIILTDRILITKNPCISSGDVRMFEAVDIPALRHLVDVVVFPMHGPRPHPDEMAGSDLDGDEYLVIWDEELFLERSEEASIFPVVEDKEKWAIPKTVNGGVDWMKCEERKADFFSESIVNGNPGMLSNAHLVVSDLYGINSKPSKSLAMKVTQTLDYQKSGVQPKRMTTSAVEDRDDRRRLIPAEKSNWKPDFLKYYRDAGYESRGILGEVFREMSKYESGLDNGEGRMEKVQLDQSFIVPEWEYYKSSVEDELGNYSHAMKSVIEHYGIGSEEELLSGMIISVKNRLSDKEEFDGTLFTTKKVIEGKVKRIQEAAREKFFESLVDWRKELEEVQSKRNDCKSDSILNRRVRSYTHNIEEIRRKAAAAYAVAYEAANQSVERGEQRVILLSFPWLFYDVLLDIRMRPKGDEDGEEEREREQSNEPLAIRLSEVIDRYCEEPSNEEKFTNFKRRFDNDVSIVAQSMRENEGLARAAFVLVEWANNVDGLSERFGEEQLLSLFVLFGLGEISIRGMKGKFIQRPRGDIRTHSKKGDHLLEFIDFVSSYDFRVRSFISFTEIGGGIVMRGKWRAFSEASLTSFLSLVTSHRLDLPMEGRRGMYTVVREYEPRAMQLPEDVITHELKKVRNALCRASGCKDVKLRIITTHLVMVSAVGSSEQLRVLSSLIYPPAPTRESASLNGTIESLASFTYDRLMRAANEVTTRRN